MKNRKGRREEGLPASCSAQPARPATGPASHRPAPQTRCSQPAARLARPSLRPSVARVPVSLACQPHVAHARAFPHLRLQPLPAGPRTSALLCFFPTPRSNRHATKPRQRWQGGPGVTPGAWPCLLGAAPTQPLRRAYATAREPLDATCCRTDQFIRIQVQWQSAIGRTIILEPI